MTAKEYLSQLRILDTRITQKIEELDQLKSLVQARGLRTDTDRVQTSPENVQESVIAKYLDLETKIDQMIDCYVTKKDKIINQIHELNDDRYIQVLYLHYVPDKNHRTKRLEEIAVTMKKANGAPYTYDHINHIHGEALKIFEKKFLNRMETAKYKS